MPSRVERPGTVPQGRISSATQEISDLRLGIQTKAKRFIIEQDADYVLIAPDQARTLIAKLTDFVREHE
jgi:hypothetical protein